MAVDSAEGLRYVRRHPLTWPLTLAGFGQSLTYGAVGGLAAALSLPMIAWGGQPFGAALGGVVAERLSISMTYLILTIGIASAAVLAWFSPLRKAGPAMIDRLMRDVE